jgi:hypothetical protein
MAGMSRECIPGEQHLSFVKLYLFYTKRNRKKGTATGNGRCKIFWAVGGILSQMMLQISTHQLQSNQAQTQWRGHGVIGCTIVRPPQRPWRVVISTLPEHFHTHGVYTVTMYDLVGALKSVLRRAEIVWRLCKDGSCWRMQERDLLLGLSEPRSNAK